MVVSSILIISSEPSVTYAGAWNTAYISVYAADTWKCFTDVRVQQEKGSIRWTEVVWEKNVLSYVLCDWGNFYQFCLVALDQHGYNSFTISITISWLTFSPMLLMYWYTK